MNQTIACLIFAALGLSTLSRAAQVQARADFSGDGLRSFYFAIGNYYQVPERQVDLVRDRALPPDEIPVAFFVAQRAATIVAQGRDERARPFGVVPVARRQLERPRHAASSSR